MNQHIENDKIIGLRSLCLKSQGFVEVFRWAASRTNDARETNLDRIVQQAKIDRRMAVKFARALEELGCGNFIEGRRGAKSRIKWNYSLKSIGKAAQGQGDSLLEIASDTADDLVDQRPDSKTRDPAVEGALTISEAKRRLALALGVSSDAIEITIRG